MMVPDEDFFFQESLKKNAAKVTFFLESTLDRCTAFPPVLKEALEYSVLGSGKYFRSFLMLETAALLGIDQPSILPVAAAVELIHAYSLVHDDLPAMDNARLRRGKPCCHVAFNEATAILVGDALIPLAFQLITEEATAFTTQQRLRACSFFATTVGGAGLVGGQILDTVSPPPSSFQELVHLQALKTGALIEFCLLAPGLLSDCALEKQKALGDFGKNLGLVFQIADDLLDLKSCQETGKDAQSDVQNEKKTWVTLLGKEAACQALFTYKEKALEALQPFHPQADMLKQAVFFAASRAA